MRRLIVIIFAFSSLTAKSQDTLIFKDGKKLLMKPELDACITVARKSSPNSNANIYCSCILQLAAQNFTLDEMKRMTTLSKVDASMNLIERLKKEVPHEFYDCITASASAVNENWTKVQEEVFYKSCINSLPKDTNWKATYDGENYCKCYLEKIKNQYSDKELLGFQNNPELKEITQDCLKNSVKLKNSKVPDFLSYYYNEFLIKTCSDLNKTYPTYIDKDTRMDNAIYTPSDTTINYNLTFVNTSKSDVNIQFLKEALLKTLSNKSKDNPSFKNFKEMNVHISYTYYDKDDNYMFEIRLPD